MSGYVIISDRLVFAHLTSKPKGNVWQPRLTSISISAPPPLWHVLAHISRLLALLHPCSGNIMQGFPSGQPRTQRNMSENWLHLLDESRISHCSWIRRDFLLGYGQSFDLFRHFFKTMSEKIKGNHFLSNYSPLTAGSFSLKWERKWGNRNLIQGCYWGKGLGNKTQPHTL